MSCTDPQIRVTKDHAHWLIEVSDPDDQTSFFGRADVQEDIGFVIDNLLEEYYERSQHA